MAYAKPSLTVDVVLFYKSFILLIRRKNNPYKNCWAIPGGFVNKGEDVTAAARRELDEETSYCARKLNLVGVFGKEGRDPRGWVVSCAYYAEYYPYQWNCIMAADDAKEAKWFEASKLPKLAFDHEEIIRKAIACYAK